MPYKLNIALVVALLLSLLAACFMGSTPMPLDRVIMALMGLGSNGDQLVIWAIRLPRALAAFLVGAALGAAGASLQGLLRNPLAEPGVLGVSAFSTLAATFSLYYGLVGSYAWIMPISAITGAILATALITLVALRTQSITTLILFGVGLSSFAGALMTLLLNLAPNPFSLADMINWTLGSVANRSFDDIAFASPFLLIGFAILWLSRRGLSLLSLGEETAIGNGLNMNRQRLATVVGTGLITGASVALAGAIGFVGIVVPHLVRPMVGYDPARTIMPSALLAGVILVLADIGVRLIPTNNELKLGVLAALLGAPAFAWIAIRRRVSHG